MNSHRAHALFLLFILAISCAAAYACMVIPTQFGIDVRGGSAIRFQMDEKYLLPELVSQNDKLFLEKAFPIMGVRDYGVTEDHVGMFTVTFPQATIPMPKGHNLPDLLLGIEDGRF